MKQPTAPSIYPEIPADVPDLSYSLQKISEIQTKLEKERDTRDSMYKHYKRAINVTDSVDTFLISASVIMASIGLAVPFMLPMEIAAIVCGTVGACVKLVRRKLYTKAQKHDKIRTLAESKLNSIYDMIFKALQDGQISPAEYKMILDELEKYNQLKQGLRSKQTLGISKEEKDRLIQEGKAQALNAIQKKIKDT